MIMNIGIVGIFFDNFNFNYHNLMFPNPLTFIFQLFMYIKNVLSSDQAKQAKHCLTYLYDI